MNKFELAAGVLGVYKRKDRRFGSSRMWCDYNGSDGMRRVSVRDVLGYHPSDIFAVF